MEDFFQIIEITYLYRELYVHKESNYNYFVWRKANLP